MAASSLQTTAIPRFLLPRLTWSRAAFKSAAPVGALTLRRHQSHQSSTYPSVQPTSTRIWQQRYSQFASPIPSSHRNFSATAAFARDHHFDTLKFVQRLKDEGFTEEQAEAMMRVLSDVIEERYATLATKGLR